MHLLAPLAALFGIEVGALIARLKRSAAAYSALALFALIGLVFALVAAHIALSEWVGPLWSALIIAAAALVVAIAIWLWSSAAEAAREVRAGERRRATEASAMATTAGLAALPMLLRNPKLGLLALPVIAAVGYWWFFVKAKDPDPD